MGVSFTPESWERLEELRDRHVQMAMRADEVLRLYRDGEATWNDVCEAERNERQAYVDWRLVKTGTGQGARHARPARSAAPTVPRDI